jgi:hypothetical protein
MAEDDVSRSIISKIEREKTLINAANQMRQSTNNPLVVQGLDTKIRDGRKNIEYLEGRLREVQMKIANQRMGEMNLQGGEGSGYSQYGPDGYEQGHPGQVGLPQPNPQFTKPGPGQGIPKPRPNYTKLGEQQRCQCHDFC